MLASASLVCRCAPPPPTAVPRCIVTFWLVRPAVDAGHDILFFWVARMVMMSLQLTDQLPFHTVYLHAMVRDKYGAKMSKSKGNVIDPLEVIDGCTLENLHDKIRNGNLPAKEVKAALAAQSKDFPDGIQQCGADALRFGLLANTSQGRDVNLDTDRVVNFRQFCNKLWNATRFALSHLETYEDDLSMSQIITALADHATTAPRDKWILSRLHSTVVAVTEYMNDYNFAAGTQALHDFWYKDLCNNYLVRAEAAGRCVWGGGGHVICLAGQALSAPWQLTRFVPRPCPSTRVACVTAAGDG